MAAKKLSAEMLQQINELGQRVPRLSNRDIANILGIHNTTVMDHRGKAPGAPLRGKAKPAAPKADSESTKETHEQDYAKGTWAINIPKTRISNLDELVEHCKIDLEAWEVERCKFVVHEMGSKPPATTEDVEVNIRNTQGRIVDTEVQKKWVRYSDEPVVTPLYSVTAFLKRKWAVAQARTQINKMREEALSYSPSFPCIIVPATDGRGSGNVAEISPVDVHFGAHIWGKETGDADWDLKITGRAFREAVENLVLRTRSYRPEKYLLVLGHDQQNADNRQGSTERLTPQSMDTRYQKVFEVSRDHSKWAVDLLLGEAGEVEVFMVPGNHDPLSTWHLGDYLQAWYRQCKQVKVENSPSFRKYWEHGVNMLMLTHGNGGKLEEYGMTMAEEQPKMWGRTRWREAHTGDKHHRRTIEVKGATVRILPSLRPSCAWSSESGHTGSIRAAEGFVWNRAEGLIGTATHSILRP